jgi:hypothetical protein
MIVFISEEGAGKGTLMHLLRRLIGEERCAETANASNLVGHFNSLISNKYLICFNELSKSQISGHTGALKELITDPIITITNKGIDSRKEQSFHRFLGCTNKTIPLNVSGGDRRFDVLRSSDELIRDFQYFDRFNAMIDSDDALASIYEYLMGVDLAGFYTAEKIDSAYHRDLKDVSEPLYVQFVRHLAQCFDDYAGNYLSHEQVATAKKSGNLTMAPRELFELFKTWRMSEGYQDHNETARVLRFNIEHANIPGITRGATRREGIEVVFDTAAIREHFAESSE